MANANPSKTRNKMKKTKNIIFAMPAAAAAMLVNPRRPAIREIIKNSKASRNIILSPLHQLSSLEKYELKVKYLSIFNNILPFRLVLFFFSANMNT